MFDKIGGKIKAVATVLTILGIVLSIIIGVAFCWGGQQVLLGMVIILVGVPMSWVASFVLYGFGELIEQVTKIADNTERQLKFMTADSIEKNNALEKISEQINSQMQK